MKSPENGELWVGSSAPRGIGERMERNNQMAPTKLANEKFEEKKERKRDFVFCFWVLSFELNLCGPNDPYGDVLIWF